MFHLSTGKFSQRLLAALVVGLLSMSFQTAYAQNSTRSKDLSETQFTEFYFGKKYNDAIKVYEDSIRKYYPELIQENAQLRYRFCDCLWNVAQKGPKKIVKKAEEELRALVNDLPKFVEARFLYASVLAKQQKPDAKDQLITSAQLGVPVLREIQNKKAKHFKYLLNEPKFILEVVKASSGGTVTVSRDFFLLPYNPNPKKDVGPVPTIDPNQVDSKQKRKTEADIEKLFQEIRTAVDRSEYDGLLEKFKSLNSLIVTYEKFGVDDAVKKQLAKFKEDYDGDRYKRIRAGLELQDAISRGNRELRQMEVELKRKKYDKVFQGFQNVSAIVDQMRSVESPEYKQRADMMFFNAKNINDKAIKQKRIDELKLIVTGIVLAPLKSNSQGETGNRALINQKIYREGQAIVDVNGDFVEGLTVFRINAGTVRFRYEDTTFIRPLEVKKEDK